MDTETPLGNNVLEGGIESSKSSPFAHTLFQLTLVQPSSIHSLFTSTVTDTFIPPGLYISHLHHHFIVHHSLIFA